MAVRGGDRSTEWGRFTTSGSTGVQPAAGELLEESGGVPNRGILTNPRGRSAQVPYWEEYWEQDWAQLQFGCSEQIRVK